jgi:cell volume regulation protein A
VHLPEVLVIAVGVLVAGVLAATFAERVGAPALLLFLGLGMLIGEDGPGGVQFDDAGLVRDVGLVAIALILFEGGFTADRAAVRRFAGAAISLATVGVAITAGAVASAAVYLFDLSWPDALLLGAIVSSTDAAAVLASVRGVALPRRVRAVLEGESGMNDPVAAAAVILLVEISTEPSFAVADGALFLGAQAIVGAVGGLLVGRLGAHLLRRVEMPPGLHPVAAVAVALVGYVGVTAAGGSGLLAAYLIGLILAGGGIPSAGVVQGFLQGIAWLAQIGLFVLLGLLVTPSRLLDDSLEAIAIALTLVLVARPLAVAVSTAPFPMRWRERVFLSWAGLRGAIPIVFATFAVAGGVTGADRMFDVTFYVVVVSVLVQGAGLRRVASALGLTAPRAFRRPTELDLASFQSLGADVIDVPVGRLGTRAGAALRELELPYGAVIVAIRREDGLIVPRGETVLEDDDRLYVLLESARMRRLELDAALAREEGGPADDELR